MRNLMKKKTDQIKCIEQIRQNGVNREFEI